jgi:predicted transcriptional regulator
MLSVRRCDGILLAKGQRGIIFVMIAKMLKDVLDQAETWPQQDQEELAEYAREIQARRTGVYIMSDEERAAVRRGLAQADRGEFVADDVVAEADKRHDL